MAARVRQIVQAEDGSLHLPEHPWWPIFIKILTVVLLPLIGWMLIVIMQVSTAVAVIQSNRFTDDDAALIERRIDLLEQEMARREHWGDDLDQIKVDVRAIMTMLESR